MNSSTLDKIDYKIKIIEPHEEIFDYRKKNNYDQQEEDLSKIPDDPLILDQKLVTLQENYKSKTTREYEFRIS